MPKETATRHPLPARRAPPVRRRRSQEGAIAVMAAAVVVITIAMFGFALDLGRAYNRKVELQGVADTVALAAANMLDGTPAGIDNAVRAAADTAGTFSVSYNNGGIAWSPAALTFGTAADSGAGGWVDDGAARASAGRIFFARVDTAALDPGHGAVMNLFIPILSPIFAVTTVTAAAVAGRDSSNALPLAICANSTTPAASLASGELVEYGFRRGISYDLMRLNPGGRTPEHFLVSPIAPAGTVGVSMMGRLDIVGPYVCTGKLAIPALRGGDVTVERGFPLASLYPEFNSRFGTYAAPCQSISAPADPNVARFDLAAASWMKFAPDGLAANALAEPDPLLTVAERPAGATNKAYGPLWSYARAVKYASYVSYRGVEPAAGYASYAPTDWATLYTPGMPVAQSYPATTPYQNGGGGAAAYKTIYNTRVLRIPLLQCPVAAGTKVPATVLGVGKFFMTVPASATALYGEFAGMEAWSAINDIARLYR